MPRRRDPHTKRLLQFPTDPETCLYAISAEARFIKFGVAAKPTARVSELQVGSPLELRLLASIHVADQDTAYLLESLVHAAAASYVVRGEWFRSCPKTLAIVEAMNLTLPEFERRIFAWAKSEISYAKRLVEGKISTPLPRLLGNS